MELNRYVLMGCAAAAISTAGIGALHAQDQRPMQDAPQAQMADDTQQEDGGPLAEARQTAQEAAQTLRQMKQETAGAKDVLAQAKAIFIVPSYARAGLIVGGQGGQGGEGILVARQGADWSGPLFYNLGGISLGAEAGVEAGRLVLVMMSEQALDGFMEQNNFSLNAEAGLTFIDWSARTGEALGDGEGDVIVWSDAEGAFGTASLSVTDVRWDAEENRAWYGADVTPQAVLQGEVSGAHDGDFKQMLKGG